MQIKRININSLSVYFSLILILFGVTACRKQLTVDPPSGSLTSDNVFENDASANSVFIGLYSSLNSTRPATGKSIAAIPVITGLSGDELSLLGGASNANKELAAYYTNSVNSGTATTASSTPWTDLYSKIYIVNLAIERLQNSNSITPALKQQLTGEAKFMRAFFYFNLVNLYGNVPLTTTSDYRVNAQISRSPVAQVYTQIINDLKDAQNLLADGYVGGDGKSMTTERLRPNKSAATALLARAYLYNKNWTDAEQQASLVLANTAEYDTVSLNNVFLKNSKEAIWQMQPVNAGWNTEYAKLFILPPTGPTSNLSEGNPVYLSNQLVNAFEAGDKRKINWVNSVTVGSGATSATYFYAYKYKSASENAPVTEYTMVLRLGELYLIRAEARAQLNEINEGLSDLNVIRHRAGLPDTTASDQTSLLNLIYQERQVELFTEGHRWLDLKRTGKLDVVMSTYAPQKGTTWSLNWALYPIPLYDITQNSNLEQNPGY